MKTKIGTILEDDVIQKLKERAMKEKRPISEIIQEAVSRYLAGGSENREIRKSAVGHFCSRPFKLSASEVREIVEEDYFNQ
jgi:predicted transcriptional regulator